MSFMSMLPASTWTLNITQSPKNSFQRGSAKRRGAGGIRKSNCLTTNSFYLINDTEFQLHFLALRPRTSRMHRSKICLLLGEGLPGGHGEEVQADQDEEHTEDHYIWPKGKCHSVPASHLGSSRKAMMGQKIGMFYRHFTINNKYKIIFTNTCT